MEKQINLEEVFVAIEKSGIQLSAKLRELDTDEELTKQGLDSLDMANILFELEDAFGIKASDESIAAGEWKTLNKIVSILNRLINE